MSSHPFHTIADPAILQEPGSQIFLARYTPKEDFITKEEIDFAAEMLQVYNQPSYRPLKKLRGYSIPTLLGYLYKTHRHYQDKRWNEMNLLLAQMRDSNTEDQPVLHAIQHVFSLYTQQLSAHIQSEEQSLFPFAMACFEAQRANKPVQSPFSLESFHAHHTNDHLADSLAEILALVATKYPAVQELFLYRVLEKKLDNFYFDLAIHEWVEEEILMPKLAAISKKTSFL